MIFFFFLLKPSLLIPLDQKQLLEIILARKERAQPYLSHLQEERHRLLHALHRPKFSILDPEYSLSLVLVFSKNVNLYALNILHVNEQFWGVRVACARTNIHLFLLCFSLSIYAKI